MQEAKKESQLGIALLVVLWVLTILMVTVLSFSLMTRAETYGALAHRDRMESQFLAEAGVERGIAEIIYRSVNGDKTQNLEGGEAWKMDGTPYTGQVGKGVYKVLLFDETGKIPLNGLTDLSGIVLRNLLVNMGVAPEEADTIVDSILDWKDVDNLHRLSGAEDEYYQSLPHPYKIRNGNFKTLEELLLVKGVTPDILYGTEANKGIIHFLTLYSNTGLINLNAAPREVLYALPGMDALRADQIIQLRGVAEIGATEEVMHILGSAYSLMQPYVGVQAGAATICTIEAKGYKDPAKGGYTLRATVAMEGYRCRYLYYRSPAEQIMVR